MQPHLTIGFVRRGFSSSGGAEAYLKRLAAGLVEKGHTVQLYASTDWPPNEWSFGPLTRLEARSAIGFADEIEKVRRDPSVRLRRIGMTDQRGCDVLMSFERIWRCDLYRAGDGVHRSWLERRERSAGPFPKLRRVFNRKHSDTLALEESLFAKGGAARVIANSRMVKDEIVRFYGFAPEKIDVVYNGVPVDGFQRGAETRAQRRETLGLGENDVAVLFAGSGWERKGLRVAIEAIEKTGNEMRLLVAGRGEQRKFRSERVQFLGVVEDMPALYAAADIFLAPTLYDPFSNACLEALAAGLPVITTRANGFSEIIESGVHGTVVNDPREIAEIRDALVFWSESTRRDEARARIRERAAHFDISANVARTLEILAQFAARAAST
jgi:UDP-glucose:(heptosyl)LPS alpha-1,3-glucosyltransferase